MTKANLLGAVALVLAATTPALPVAVTWDFTATPSVVGPGGSVAVRLSAILSPPDPGFFYAALAFSSTAEFSDDAGHFKLQKLAIFGT